MTNLSNRNLLEDQKQHPTPQRKTEQPPGKEDAQFWQLTTKPYFFVIYYLVLAFIFVLLTLINTEGIVLDAHTLSLFLLNLPTMFVLFILTTFYMSSGLAYLAIVVPIYGPHQNVWDLRWIHLLTFILNALYGYMMIQVVSRNKSNRILSRWLIVLLLLLITLSFAGRIVGDVLGAYRLFL